METQTIKQAAAFRPPLEKEKYFIY